MVLSTIIRKNPDQEWNTRLKGTLATVHQTSNYAEYMKKTNSQTNLYISFENKGEVVGQMVLHKTSRLKRRLESKFGDNIVLAPLFGLIKNVKPLYEWNFGPIIFNNDFRNEIFSEISKFRNTFTNPIRGSLHPLDNSSIELVNNNWKEKKLATFLINLTLSEDQLWKNIDRHSGRKPVTRAINKGLKVKPMKDLDDLKIHHLLLNEGRKIAHIEKYPLSYLEAAWTILQEVGQAGFIVWLDSIPLASTLMSTFNGYINEWGFARSKLDTDNLYGATDLVKWHIIQWGHNSGFRLFDLSGVDPTSTDKKIQGIFNFKKKWGGTLQDWYHYYSNL